MTKESIIREIKRTAAENGGKVPGLSRFAALTGIKESDWIGRFWVRWGDAISEAGLQPNEMRGAYDSAYLLNHLVALIRKLRKFPTRPELKLEAYTSPGFPDPKTFWKRFGPKDQMAQTVIDYCQTDPELASVAAICRQVVALPSPEESNSKNAQGETLGYVYLIKAGKHYKIGKANSVDRRFGQLRIQLPDRADLIHQISTDDPFGIEAYWHGRFRDRRCNGEWFSLSMQDVKAFKRRKFM